MAAVATSSLRDLEEHMFHMDHESALLIAELQLQEALEISNQTKGKARADAPLSDQEIALRLQAEELSGWKQTHQDAAMAQSIDSALGIDEGIIQAYRMIEETAAADRRAAELLQQGSTIPQPNEAQRTVGENRAFYDVFEDTSSTPAGATPAREGAAQRLSSVPSHRPTVNFSRQSTSSQRAAGPSVDRLKREFCASCSDSYRIVDMLQGECEHYWCNECLTDVTKVYIRDESLHPLRCCQKAFQIADLSRRIKNGTLFAQFEAKRREYEVSPQDRVYCSRPTCSAFLGSANSYPGHLGLWGRRVPATATCTTCSTATCVECRKGAHPGDTCTQNEGADQVRALAREAGWQTCPGCSAVVELNHGCYHITCRCRTQFCYLCAVEWKGCTCPQWEERRLLATAEVRAEHLMGGQQARQAQPEVFAQQLQRAVENIRQNHGCLGHHWVGRTGGGYCEECGDHMPVFLKMCRNCNLLACRRCTLNRL